MRAATPPEWPPDKEQLRLVAGRVLDAIHGLVATAGDRKPAYRAALADAELAVAQAFAEMGLPI